MSSIPGHLRSTSTQYLPPEQPPSQLAAPPTYPVPFFTELPSIDPLYSTIPFIHYSILPPEEFSALCLSGPNISQPPFSPYPVVSRHELQAADTSQVNTSTSSSPFALPRPKQPFHVLFCSPPPKSSKRPLLAQSLNAIRHFGIMRLCSPLHQMMITQHLQTFLASFLQVTQQSIITASFLRQRYLAEQAAKEEAAKAEAEAKATPKHSKNAKHHKNPHKRKKSASNKSDAQDKQEQAKTKSKSKRSRPK